MFSEPIEGQWWLPESPERKRFGRLAFDEEETWQLVVAGGLQAPPELRGGVPHSVGEDSAADVPVIHGRANDGTAISLFGCWGGGLPWPLEPTQEVWRFQSIVQGSKVVAPDEAMKEIRLRLGPLLEWAGRDGPSVRYTDNEATITTTTEEAGSAHLAGDLVTLVLDHTWSAGPTEGRVSQGAMFSIHPADGIVFAEAMKRFALPLRDLFCFLTLGHVEIDEFSARPVVDDDGTRYQPMLRYKIQLQRPVKLPKTKGQHEMLAPRSALGLSIQELLGGWLELMTRQQKAIRLLLLPHYAPYLYADDKLMTAFLAVEAYHDVAIGGTAKPPEEHARRVDAIVAGAPPEYREWANEILRGKNSKGQRRKLQEVIERAGPTGDHLLEAVPGFVDLALKSRHRVAHPSPTDESAGVRYIAAGMGLRWLLRHCLLVDLGLPEERVAELVATRHPFENELHLLRHWSSHLG